MKATEQLIEKMEAAAKNVRLDALYQAQVDQNLYEDGCDPEKSRDLVFGNDEFFFVHPDDTNRYIQHGFVFVSSVDANKAIASSLDELIDYLREEAFQNA